MWDAIGLGADTNNFLVGNSSDSWSNGALPIALNLSYPKFSASLRAMCPHLPLGYLGEYRTKFAAKIEFSFFIFSLLWIIKQPFIKLATRLDVGDNFPLVQVVTHYVFSKRKRQLVGTFARHPGTRRAVSKTTNFMTWARNCLPRNIPLTNHHRPFFSVVVPC